MHCLLSRIGSPERHPHAATRRATLPMMGLLALALMVPGLFGTPPAQAATYLVTPDGSGDFPTIQAALDATLEADIIELADGFYCGEGNRDLDFAGKAVMLRSVSDDPTTCVIDCQGSLEDPHRGFHFYANEGPFTVIRGLTVTGGHTDDC